MLLLTCNVGCLCRTGNNRFGFNTVTSRRAQQTQSLTHLHDWGVSDRAPLHCWWMSNTRLWDGNCAFTRNDEIQRLLCFAGENKRKWRRDVYGTFVMLRSVWSAGGSSASVILFIFFWTVHNLLERSDNPSLELTFHILYKNMFLIAMLKK